MRQYTCINKTGMAYPAGVYFHCYFGYVSGLDVYIFQMKTYCCEVNPTANVTLQSAQTIFTSGGGGGGVGGIEPRGENKER
jgi:hypothetical protein